ncbi:MAG: GAF domain-containing protein, partial [Casimicrobiaceae bacterium]
EYEHGKRLHVESHLPSTDGPWAQMAASRMPFVANTREDLRREFPDPVPGTDQGMSMAMVPILAGDRVLGTILLENYEREHAFGESEVRLLGTVAASMGVALENARLFDETQRLLKETEQRAAELAIINSVQHALAAKLDLREIYDVVGDKIRGIFAQADLEIRIHDPATGTIHTPYVYEFGKRIEVPSEPLGTRGFAAHLLRTGETIVVNERMAQTMRKFGSTHVEGTGLAKSAVYVPLRASGVPRGLIALSDMSREHAYADSDVRLLETLANSMSVALENARLFDETQRLLKETEQRAAELAVINSIQEGVAAELNFQSIVDLVGDKLRVVLNTDDIGIRWFDHVTRTVSYLYEYEHGERLALPPTDTSNWERMQSRREPLIRNTQAEMALVGTLPGTDLGKSGVDVPIIGSDRVIGSIVVENYDREYAFSASDIRLLTTVASSMGVALENARLFDETQRLLRETERRASELAVINSIQEGMAAELNFQAIVDLVGDKLRDVFHTGDIAIRWWDEVTRKIQYLYEFEHGQRLAVAPMAPPPNSTWEMMATSRQPVVVNSLGDMKVLGMGVLPGTDQALSMAAVPILRGETMLGAILLENHDRENAFGDAELRLLTTIAASIGVALENARLFDETQRLLKETEQRAAELAVINSIQEGVAAELNFQAIVDLVGDKLREVLRADNIGVTWHEPETDLLHYLYAVEHGQRISLPPAPPVAGGEWHMVLASKRPVVHNTLAELESLPGKVFEGTDACLARLSVPILGSDRVLGLIGIESFDRENAFGESEVRLISTVAASMGVALENARLFDETQRLLKETEQRAAELSVINSIQEGMAAELDFQAIIDLVGDKIREVFDTNDIGIRWWKAKTGQIHYLYEFEHGRRLEVPPNAPKAGGPWMRMMETRAPWVANTAAELAGKIQLVPGTDPCKSIVNVPILAGDRMLGSISLENMERENAFGEPEVRLLSTIASSMGVALENARLFDETQRLLNETEQRATELAVINSIQEGMAAELDFQTIIDLVGDKLREVFRTSDIGIRWYDPQTNMLHMLYDYEQGVRIQRPSGPPTPGGIWSLLTSTRQPVVHNNKAESEALRGVFMTHRQTTSSVYVPILASDRVLGYANLWDFDREFAFGESDVRLLSTVAASMGVALENARLFNETQRLLKETEQRAAELALINSIQEGMAAELAFQAIIDLVGDKLREVFGTGDIGIRWHDAPNDRIHYMYQYEHGQRLVHPPAVASQSPSFARLAQTRQPIVLNTSGDAAALGIGVV